MTGHHHNCKKEISWYDKTWRCDCQHGDKDESNKPENQNDSGTQPELES
jgi:hypothetical protein